MRWEYLSWTDPTYQTTKEVKFLDELGISELAQPTKHTLNIVAMNGISRPPLAIAFAQFNSNHQGTDSKAEGPVPLPHINVLLI
jgi:hypothetical protein